MNLSRTKQRLSARSKSMVMGELSRSGRPCTPGLQERVLKAGWLKKQRSIMKNWQLRWFVLRADQLYFYKDEEETKPQGCIPLHGSQVTELSANPEEPGRHLFEVVPGKAGDWDRGALGQEALLLMASSHADMEEWVKAIRRVIWAPVGGGSIFGQRLEDTMQYDQRFGPRRVPRLVEQCVDFIQDQGLREEGLFRLPGQANLVKELQDAFDCGDKPLFDSNTDVHTVASLLKLYLRELPEPVVPFDKYQDFLTCAQLLAKDEDTGTQELARQVKTLPQANFNLLKYICKFLDEVQSHSNENKMSVQNLATVFGPNILRPKMEDPVKIMEGTSQVQHLMTVLISEHKQLYEGADADPADGIQDTNVQNQRSMVGWISEEDCSTTAGSIQPSGDLCSSTPCLDAIGSVSSRLTPQEKAEPAVSPSKQAKSLPGWKSFKGTGKMGGSSVDIPSMSTGSWWMNGLSSLRSHRRTSSGERVGGASGPGGQNRLSTYDNVSPCSLSVPSVVSKAWSTLPPETSAEESGDTKPSSLNYGKEEALNKQNGEEPLEFGVSNSALDPCASSTSGNEVDCMAVARICNSNGSAEDLATWVTELKEELRQQKVAYGTRAKKLESSVAALQAQVEHLQEELDQERKKHRMLEIKLRNSERAHEDAETRNRLLQKEMEEFFSTLGDLTLSTGTGKM
ncbi:rho GTPase-activating protein 22 isoform X2 [Arapaima gigas]